MIILKLHRISNLNHEILLEYKAPTLEQVVDAPKASGILSARRDSQRTKMGNKGAGKALPRIDID